MIDRPEFFEILSQHLPEGTLGKNIQTKDGTVIGTDGFGYERDEEGKLVHFPHYGKVRIGSNVSIGANTTIDRGNLSDTVIGYGTKIDNLVHIGHNAIIGESVLIVAGSVIGGSAEIGNFTTINMGVLVFPHVKIGSNCIIGAGSVVTKNIPNNSIAYGNPCKVKKKNPNRY